MTCHHPQYLVHKSSNFLTEHHTRMGEPAWCLALHSNHDLYTSGYWHHKSYHFALLNHKYKSESSIWGTCLAAGRIWNMMYECSIKIHVRAVNLSASIAAVSHICHINLGRIYGPNKRVRPHEHLPTWTIGSVRFPLLNQHGQGQYDKTI